MTVSPNSHAQRSHDEGSSACPPCPPPAGTGSPSPRRDPAGAQARGGGVGERPPAARRHGAEPRPHAVLCAGRRPAQADPALQPRPSSCLVTAQYFWRKTSAWFSVIPAAVVTTLRLSPQLTRRRDPFDAI